VSNDDIPYSRAGETLAPVPRVARGIYFCPSFLLFLCPTSFSILWRTCVYVHICDCLDSVYELLLLPNYTASETLLHKSRAMRNVDWICIVGVPIWRDWASTWHWTKRFAVLFWNRNNTRSIYFHIFSLTAFLEEAFVRYMIKQLYYALIIYSLIITCWDRVSTVIKALCYKSEGRWFDSRWSHWNFSLT